MPISREKAEVYMGVVVSYTQLLCPPLIHLFRLSRYWVGANGPTYTKALELPSFCEIASMNKRIWQHILFWVIYTAVHAWLNTSFPASSDLKYELNIRFLRFWGNEVLMLPLKLWVTYGFLYWILPRYLMKVKYWQAGAYLVILILPTLLLYRLMIYYVASPLLYGDFPTYEVISVRRLLFSFLDISSAVAIASTLKLLRSRMEGHRREQALIREKLASELHFLRAQTNPHFLFNTLNNIYALARKQSSQTAEVVMKLSTLLRFMLYECTSPRIPLTNELKIIQGYIELEKLRYDDRLSVEYSESVDLPQQPIAPLLLLPLVENAFKHGASESRFEVEIEIRIFLKNAVLELEIVNSKETDRQTSSDGIGLANVKRQLELIYPGRHQLHIEESFDEFKLYLQIELEA